MPSERIEMGGTMTSGAAPCHVCGGEGGKAHYARPGVPARWCLARFGIEGRGCIRCYNNLYAASRRGDPDPLATARAIVAGIRVAFGRPVVSRRLGPQEIRRAALAIHSASAMRGDRIEARRLGAVDRDPAAPLSPAAGAREALREYRATIFGQSRGQAREGSAS